MSKEILPTINIFPVRIKTFSLDNFLNPGFF